ncbi:MAG: S-adenosylmethionine:tRNA ribosyltransferase-isomerase [Bacteroidales bacterium]
MKKIYSLNINDYYYKLPDERIAKYPASRRDASKLLLYINGNISEDKFRNIGKYLPSDSLLVFNNTRVIRARLLFHKSTGAAIEVFCIEPVSPVEYQQSFSSTREVEWKCIIGNLKKWKIETITLHFDFKGIQYDLTAEKISPDGEAWIVRFLWNPSDLTFGEVIEGAGHIPLPPYLNRNDEAEDYSRYQTIYAIVKGSVAAPTAGLHFTDAVFSDLKEKGIDRADITLHVGAGTFKPVKSGYITDHKMHCEHYFVTSESLEKLISNRGRIIAVGTTSVRTLESLYWLGVSMIEGKIDSGELFTNQWEYDRRISDVSMEDSFNAILDFMRDRKISILHASTKIMILPFYKFRVVNGMITNFHQPKSTLLLLIAAWTGNRWRDLYTYAMESGFRFLSYGDSCLLL